MAEAWVRVTVEYADGGDAPPCKAEAAREVRPGRLNAVAGNLIGEVFEAMYALSDEMWDDETMAHAVDRRSTVRELDVFQGDLGENLHPADREYWDARRAFVAAAGRVIKAAAVRANPEAAP